MDPTRVTDAAWSVLSSNIYSKSTIPESFYQSGETETKRLIGSLKRSGVEPPFRIAVEYGCGIDRMSLPLSRHCGHLYAYDISSTHLELGRERAAGAGAINISFEQV